VVWLLGAAQTGGAQNVNMATLSSVPASRVACTGDALKSCTLGQDNFATIDVKFAGPGQSSLLPFILFIKPRPRVKV